MGSLEARTPIRLNDLAYLKRTGRHNGPVLDRLVPAALQSAADQQHIRVPGENITAAIAKDLATDLLALRERLNATDTKTAELLTDHPAAACPVWGPRSPPSSSPWQAASAGSIRRPARFGRRCRVTARH